MPRAEHTISRKDISHNALKVLYRLNQHKYSAYLVGGCLRDILLNQKPKDFDIVTNASPENIKKLFRNCLLIGRRFRLAHIRFGREILEVSTFRAQSKKKSFKHRKIATHGMLLRDNVYGTIEEDVWRRDFTMNALYYNIADFSLVDYCGGLADIQNKIVRIIGEPRLRYQEDPVRLLRAIRFAGKLDFQLDAATAEPIQELAPLLRHVPPARLFEEVLKLFHHGQALKNYQLLQQYHLINELFPRPEQDEFDDTTDRLLELACKNTDKRIQQGKTVSPAFLFAVFLWPTVQTKAQQLIAQHTPTFIAYQHAVSYALSKQQKLITIPRRYSTTIREIWDLQHRLLQRRPFMLHRLMNHPRFRAAYDFLLLRAKMKEIDVEIAHWWARFLEADDDTRKQLIQAATQAPRGAKRPRRGRTI
ncbi:polynucleotide adenylyltransferase PcnB [Candidatus Rickettsiella isopodorum]|uniref:polynucleotide adenylyltransferase PcnB n=1 Tax=Candidatus Rickettsiella isopodorum TaxID=1225476 RepID=UPI002481E6A8|nr:polynucleotide adenylyltransferase PcnB [Candidatus Rickettsiella isopodorum]